MKRLLSALLVIAFTVPGLAAEKDERAERALATAQGALGRASALPRTLLSDPSFHVRAAVARAIAASPANALEALRTLEGDSSVTVRAAAVRGLTTAVGESYLPTLRSLAGSSELPLRLAAVRAAGNAGPWARPVIDTALVDELTAIRVEALEAVGALGEGAGDPVRDA